MAADIRRRTRTDTTEWSQYRVPRYPERSA
jgi:hypothetical protein